MDKINITVLVENTIRRAGLLAEHGLSLLIEAGGKRVLFDTGQGMALLHNARALGVKLHELDAIVLSHGHYDHTGGLAAVLGESRRIPVYLHPGGLAARFTPSDRGRARGIGIRYRDELILRSRPGDIVWTREPAHVLAGISVTGEIPRGTDFEDTGGAFFLDEFCTEADPVADDQALYIESPRGLIVVVGCAHSGVVNSLDYVSRLTGANRVHAVIGGMHLLRASPERLEATVAALRRYEVEFLAPGHCTGLAATALLREQFPSQFCECIAGTRFEFGS